MTIGDYINPKFVNRINELKINNRHNEKEWKKLNEEKLLGKK